MDPHGVQRNLRGQRRDDLPHCAFVRHSIAAAPGDGSGRVSLGSCRARIMKPGDAATMPTVDMPTLTEIRAPRGSSLRCKGWKQEAALRMLMNNLDPEVAERPQDLVVYGGSGKAARDWPSYHAIVRELEALGNDETLLVQSGKPVGVFRTHEEAPRVLIANSNLVGHWSNWD